MNKNEAYKVLKCTNEDDLDDAVSFLLFYFKAKHLQIIPPLKVVKAHLKRLDRIIEAYILLKGDEKEKKAKAYLFNQNSSLESFFYNYQEQIALIRLEISNSKTPLILKRKVEILLVLQTQLFIKLDSYLLIEIKKDKYPIKLSDTIDVYAIQKELLSLQLQENKISEYIRTQINTIEFDVFSEITKSVINASQQIEFNGLRREI